MGILSNLFGGGQSAELDSILAENPVILDVRTPQEYAGGHIKGSKNIPLDRIGGSINKLKKGNRPIVTCCRSGMRSQSAADQLNAAGIKAVNGGPWNRLESKLR